MNVIPQESVFLSFERIQINWYEFPIKRNQFFNLFVDFCGVLHVYQSLNKSPYIPLSGMPTLPLGRTYWSEWSACPPHPPYVRCRGAPMAQQSTPAP